MDNELQELGFELRHIGINCTDEEEANQVADRFDTIFGLTKKPGNSSVFAGTAVECMKQPGAGKNGHIAIATNNIEKAQAYLESKGHAFDADSKKFNAKGELTAIYLKEEIGGFAVHLVQK